VFMQNQAEPRVSRHHRGAAIGSYTYNGPIYFDNTNPQGGSNTFMAFFGSDNAAYAGSNLTRIFGHSVATLLATDMSTAGRWCTSLARGDGRMSFRFVGPGAPDAACRAALKDENMPCTIPTGYGQHRYEKLQLKVRLSVGVLHLMGSVAISVLLTTSAVACGLGAAPFQHGHTSRASASSVD
jgi:hypothetical protein